VRTESGVRARSDNPRSRGPAPDFRRDQLPPRRKRRPRPARHRQHFMDPRWTQSMQTFVPRQRVNQAGRSPTSITCERRQSPSSYGTFTNHLHIKASSSHGARSSGRWGPAPCRVTLPMRRRGLARRRVRPASLCRPGLSRALMVYRWEPQGCRGCVGALRGRGVSADAQAYFGPRRGLATGRVHDVVGCSGRCVAAAQSF
jgi:hypothetical protein